MVARARFCEAVRVEREAYRITADYEASHWWFRSRRVAFLNQVQQAVAKLGDRGRPLAILDYGCGTGFNLPYLSPYGVVSGADVRNESLVEFQKSQGFSLIDLRQDISEYDERFDLIVCLDVLEHMEDDVDGLGQIVRLLAPKGQIVLTVPAYESLWSGEDELSQHRRRYTAAGLRTCAESADCRVDYLSYFNLAVLPAMALSVWARRLFTSDWRRRSNLGSSPGWLNPLLSAVTSLEARFVGAERCRLPAGASLIARLGAN